jgi:hypothetical protein
VDGALVVGCEVVLDSSDGLAADGTDAGTGTEVRDVSADAVEVESVGTREEDRGV